MSVRWRDACGGEPTGAILVGISTSGLAMLTERKATPPLRTRIQVKPARHLWGRSAEVLRVDSQSDVLNLVAAQFEESATASAEPDLPAQQAIPQTGHTKLRSAG
jgi:hypothetical protein